MELTSAPVSKIASTLAAHPPGCGAAFSSLPFLVGIMPYLRLFGPRAEGRESGISVLWEGA